MTAETGTPNDLTRPVAIGGAQLEGRTPHVPSLAFPRVSLTSPHRPRTDRQERSTSGLGKPTGKTLTRLKATRAQDPLTGPAIGRTFPNSSTSGCFPFWVEFPFLPIFPSAHKLVPPPSPSSSPSSKLETSLPIVAALAYLPISGSPNEFLCDKKTRTRTARVSPRCPPATRLLGCFWWFPELANPSASPHFDTNNTAFPANDSPFFFPLGQKKHSRIQPSLSQARFPWSAQLLAELTINITI